MEYIKAHKIYFLVGHQTSAFQISIYPVWRTLHRCSLFRPQEVGLASHDSLIGLRAFAPHDFTCCQVIIMDHAQHGWGWVKGKGGVEA